MNISNTVPKPQILGDLIAGAVVFIVAVPLCLGIALASNTPLFSGLIAGIVGGIVVGAISGSHTSVSGPAAGLTAVVAAQISALGSFEAFLLAVILAGVIQIGLGVARLGFVSAFFPSSVIRGLLAAIGVLLILKQIPHVFGHDADPLGDLNFLQPDKQNTFSELGLLFGRIHPGATVIGLVSIAVLLLWSRYKPLKRSIFPAPLFVVALGTGLGLLFQKLGAPWIIESKHLVEVPIASSLPEFLGFLSTPDMSSLNNPQVFVAAITIALVASLETLLNLEAIDKIDPKRRVSPASRELVAQGIGNIIAGALGGLPVTSVIVRSSINIQAGGQSRFASIFHGCLLLFCVALAPQFLNLIPLSCLAAILLVTGAKLVSPKIVKKMWSMGSSQFIPFLVTIVAIVLTDLLLGVTVGLAVAIGFILNSNLRTPIRRVVEKHLGGEVLRIELGNQVSFLNRAALSKAFYEVSPGGKVLIDAQNSDYIDPDVLDLIRTYTSETSPALDVEVSLVGFQNKYELRDRFEYADYSTRELQSAITPQQVLQILKDGHERFRLGQRLTRDLTRQAQATSKGQHPLAVILSCIDSRVPAELIFDVGVGDIMNVRIAGNVSSRKVLGSIEYACSVAGAKLVLVMGHTCCGAVIAAISQSGAPPPSANRGECEHVDFILKEIQQSCDSVAVANAAGLPADKFNALVAKVARKNVQRTIQELSDRSATLHGLIQRGDIAIAGAMYNIEDRDIEFFMAPESEERDITEWLPSPAVVQRSKEDRH